MVGERIVRRLKMIPANIKKAFTKAETESLSKAVKEVPDEFGKSNREAFLK